MTPTYVHIPVTTSDRRALLAERPGYWEYYLLASTMLARMEEFEPQWRDYLLGFVETVGPAITRQELAEVIIDRSDIATSLVHHFNGLFSIEIQELAYGAPGEPGDAAMIMHLGTRLVDGYGALLRWSEEVRGLRFPNGAENLRYMVSHLVDEPLRAYREFFLHYAQTIDGIEELAAATDGGPVDLEFTLLLTVNPEFATELGDEMRRLTDIWAGD